MATTAQTAKTVADEALANGAQAFAAGKETFQKNVDSTVAAFGDLTVQSKKNIEALTESATIASETAQTLGAQAVAFSKKAFEDQVATAKKLAGAKTIQEAFDIQSGYAKSAMDAYMVEANRWSDLMTASVAQSWKPINERVTAAVSQIQAR